MTIVCAFHKLGYGTVIGSDNQETLGYEALPLMNGKWVIGSHWAAGIGGEAKAFDLITTNSQALLNTDITPQTFISKYLAIIREDGWEPIKEQGVPIIFNVRIILASACEIYDISGNGHVRRSEWVAIGSGSEFATGASYVLRQQNSSPETIVRTAVRAAIQFSTTCGGEVWTRSLRHSSCSSALTYC